MGDLLRGGDKCGGDHLSLGDKDLDLLRLGDVLCRCGGERDGDLLDLPTTSFRTGELLVLCECNGDGDLDKLLSFEVRLCFLLFELLRIFGEGDLLRVLGDGGVLDFLSLGERDLCLFANEEDLGSN